MTFYKKFQDNPLQTRADYQNMVNDLFEPMIPYFNDTCTDVDFHEGAGHFKMKSSYLEGFARPLWGIIPLVAGGGEFKHWDMFHKGIINGTDPKHPNYWGETNHFNQHSVEMAAFGVMLALIPEHGYDPLPEHAKNNLATWLANMQNFNMPQNNWLFFTVLVQEGLRNVGRTDLINEDRKFEYLEKLKNWYLGDGWYADGISGAVDHYGGFAMHLYGLIYAHIRPDCEYAKVFVERGNQAAHQFKYWFANSGETLAQGRSLTYRFACAGLWAGLAISDIKDPSMPLSQVKYIWSQHLKSWQDKPMFSADGLMSRGYYYPNLLICENYNSPTSPYWAMKIFMPLMLPESHEFWQSPAEPVPYEKEILPIPAGKMIAQRINGHSIVHYGAHIHRWLHIDKYNKFAYSTNFGCEMNSLHYADLNHFGDNILVFSYDDGDNWIMRQNNLETTVNDNKMITKWRAGTQHVTTTIEVLENGLFVRSHEFTLTEEALVAETGFAIDNWYHDVEELASTELKDASSGAVDIIAKIDKHTEVGHMMTVKGVNGVSAIKSLDGYEKEALASGRVHSNVISPRTKTPVLKATLPAGNHKLVHVFYANPDRNGDLSGIINFKR